MEIAKHSQDRLKTMEREIALLSHRLLIQFQRLTEVTSVGHHASIETQSDLLPDGPEAFISQFTLHALNTAFRKFQGTVKIPPRGKKPTKICAGEPES